MNAIPLLAIMVCCGVSAFAYFSMTGKEAPAATAAATAPSPMTTDELAAWEPLAFGEIYQHPAGPRGLELSEKGKSLEGRKVALRGFMVRYPHPDPSAFLFSPERVFHDYAEYRLVDSLPVETVHVFAALPEGKAHRYYKEEMILLGTIEYGPRQEVDGRISHIRLRLDHALDAATTTQMELVSSLALQRERVFNAERLKETDQPSP